MKLLSEFVARWKKEMFPTMVTEGKSLTKEIAKNKGLNSELEKVLTHRKAVGDDNRVFWKGMNRWLDEERPGYNKKNRTILDVKSTQIRQEKIQKLSEKIKNNPPFQPSSTKGLKLKSNPNIESTKVISSVINPTNNNNARQAFNQRLQSVGKSAMKKELLGVAAIGGVIGGIALARKVRSDKNKKRGKYRRF